MKILQSITVVAMILTSCKNNDSNFQKEKHVNSELTSATGNKMQLELTQKLKVDQAFIGMTIRELRSIYKDSEFMEEPVNEFGIDGESNGLVVKRNNERLFFVWTMQGQDSVHGITILSESIKIDNNVHVGMSVKEFTKKYPNLTFNIDIIDYRYEYIFVPEFNYRVEFLTTDSTRIAEYDYDKPEPEFKEINRPTATIDRISIN